MNSDIPTLDERIERARALRVEGYNCSQCVFMVFDDIHSMSPDDAARMTAGLGGGVGGQHQVCGTVSAMSMLIGASRFGNPKDKLAVYGKVKECCNSFSERNGSIVCAELLADRANRKPCSQYIEDSITILHEKLSEA